MKKIHAFVLLVAFAATALAASAAVPVFNATLTVGKENRFVLLGSDGKASSWLQVGDTFEGYSVKGYDAKTGTLELEKDGKVTPVTIAADAAVAAAEMKSMESTPGTIEDATAVLDSMHFERMLDRTMAGMKKQQMAMVQQMMGRLVKPGQNKDAIVAFQQKVIDTMMSAVNGADVKADVAKVYSEVFSKQELQALANFYSTPVGQEFSDKQPELSQKINAVIMPRMLAVMPKIQQMGQEFAAQQKAAAAAAAQPAAQTAPAPAAEPAPKP
ncbi:MAG TPA: DUF2059 domain-containing protein [Opitutaceae bacterium]|nr:DUF2059 domain-containing protein [Opitutaceae bacterium]